jgi:hypothetical protein
MCLSAINWSDRVCVRKKGEETSAIHCAGGRFVTSAISAMIGALAYRPGFE